MRGERFVAIVALACAACSDAAPRWTCLNEYVDHYVTSTALVSNGKTLTPIVTTTPVYECDVWARVSGDSVYVSTKAGHDRRIVFNTVTLEK